jgi:transposase InsO family protein
MSRLLNRRYHDLHYPEAFTARSNLKKLHKIPEFDDWADKEDVLGEFSQYRKFKRRPTVAHSRNSVWSIDLAEFRPISKFNKGYNYLAIACDVLSRFCYAIPLKSKRPTEVAEEFAKLFKRVRPSLSVFVDAGSEFKGDFKRLLDKLNIQTWVARTSETKSAIAERAILKFKQRLYRYFHYNKTKKWIDVYQLIIDGMNNSFHRTIKMKPSECTTAEMQRQAFINAYHDKMRFIPRPALKEEDRVRITRLRHPLTKRYLQSFTTERFVVTKVLPKENQNIYKLRDENKEDIIGTFSKPELRVSK